jgi:hypothetical protein
MKILVCGDSFCVTDPRFCGLHWSEKLLNLSEDIILYNLAFGGASNALILLQLLQGLKLNPDFVVLSFTNHGRYEYDKNIDACPFDLTANDIAAYIKNRYTTNMYKTNSAANAVIDKWILEGSSENFEKLKNYFYISHCLTLLTQQNINFCFSLGGFSYKQDHTELINSNYLTNTLTQFAEHELATNLWYHILTYTKNEPCFHVDKDEIQMLFANECFQHATKNKKLC